MIWDLFWGALSLTGFLIAGGAFVVMCIYP